MRHTASCSQSRDDAASALASSGARCRWRPANRSAEEHLSASMPQPTPRAVQASPCCCCCLIISMLVTATVHRDAHVCGLHDTFCACEHVCRPVHPSLAQDQQPRSRRIPCMNSGGNLSSPETLFSGTYEASLLAAVIRIVTRTMTSCICATAVVMTAYEYCDCVDHDMTMRTAAPTPWHG